MHSIYHIATMESVVILKLLYCHLHPSILTTRECVCNYKHLALKKMHCSDPSTQHVQYKPYMHELKHHTNG